MTRPTKHFARFNYFALFALACTFVASTAQADVFELRTYVTNEGKLDALNARFRNHTVKLFEKHGIVSVGYWVPSDGEASKNTLIYILRHKSREAAAASWEAFKNDPEWQKVAKESQVDGQILAKPPESVYMEAVDYSAIK
jgi:NIPSNAP